MNDNVESYRKFMESVEQAETDEELNQIVKKMVTDSQTDPDLRKNVEQMIDHVKGEMTLSGIEMVSCWTDALKEFVAAGKLDFELSCELAMKAAEYSAKAEIIKSRTGGTKLN